MQDVLISQLVPVLAPFVVSAVLGGLKYLYPKLKQNVPNLIWPLALFGLARVGTAACSAAGVACSGSPFEWSPETVQALVVTALAVMVREGAKHLPDLKDKLVAAVAKLATKPAAPEPPPAQ